MFVEVACQSELVLGSKVEKECLLQKEVLCYVEHWHTPYSLKVMLKSGTRKQLRCAFGDVACQSKLVCNSKVEKERLLW